MYRGLEKLRIIVGKAVYVIFRGVQGRVVAQLNAQYRASASSPLRFNDSIGRRLASCVQSSQLRAYG
jgi:hypothetical protein